MSITVTVGRKPNPNSEAMVGHTCTNPQCGKTFTAWQHRGAVLYCSNACRRAVWAAQRREITCQNPACGKAFTITPSESETKFCSRACAGPSKAKRQQKPGSRITLTCQNAACGKEFEAWRHQRRAKFCSIECRKQAGYAPMVEKVCAACGNPFHVARYRGDQQHCSRLCAGESAPLLVRLTERATRIEKVCEGCGQPFTVTPSLAKQRYCSMKCRVPKPIQEPTATEIAYAAGIFDGEGCVSIMGGANKRHVHVLAVEVANTHLPLLAWFSERFGGAVKENPHRPSRHKVLGQWRAFGDQAAEVLRLWLPHLIVKHDQAETALCFHAERKGLDPANRETYKVRLQEMKAA